MGDEREGPVEAHGEGTGATRSQHVVLQGAADARTMAAALRPAIERSRSEGAPSEPLCLVVVPTVEQAFHAARQARLLLADPNIRVVPVSAVTRAQRLLQSAAVSVVTGTVQDLLQLRRQAALRLDSLRAVVLTGLDVMLAEGEQDHLVALLADAPSDATRIATLDQEVPETEAFLEAHLRRARRIVTVPTPEQPLAVVPRYAIATRAGRADALRALLDEVDPPSLAVVAFSDRGIVEAREALEEMGVIVDDRNVHVTSEAPPEHVALAVFWETPHTTELLDRVLSTRPAESVSLVQPNEVPAFQRLTGNATTAWNPPMRRETIASRTSQLRTAIRSTLANGAGASASELALLEPLLESYDALEIAAAALRLYEGAKRETNALKTRIAMTAAAPAAAPAVATASRGVPPGRQRVFLAVGKRDNVRVGDVVGAIANEGGVPGDRIGQVELFESHTLVELSADDATRVVDALASASVRGRRVNARLDTGGPPRGERRGGAFGPRDRGPRGGDREDRERPRGFSRGDSDRPRRGGPRNTSEARRSFSDRSPRERAESSREWSERGERLQRSRRTQRESTRDYESDD